MTHDRLIAAYTADQAIFKHFLCFRICVRKSSTAHLEAAYLELDDELTYLTYGQSAATFNATLAGNQTLCQLRDTISETTLDQLYQTTVKDYFTEVFTINGQFTLCDAELLDAYGCHLYDMRFYDLMSYYHAFRASHP